jgi:hypothetical protein
MLQKTNLLDGAPSDDLDFKKTPLNIKPQFGRGTEDVNTSFSSLSSTSNEDDKLERRK